MEHECSENIQNGNSGSKEHNDLQSTMLTNILSDLISLSKSFNSEDKNHNSSIVANSGNSDIDIKIHIDFSSIALAILYSLFASKQLSSDELETALRRLEVLKQA